jgi:hypothetical protein
LRILDLLPVGQGSEVFKTQVDANTAAHAPRGRLPGRPLCYCLGWRSTDVGALPRQEAVKKLSQERHFLPGSSTGVSVPKNR